MATARSRSLGRMAAAVAVLVGAATVFGPVAVAAPGPTDLSIGISDSPDPATVGSTIAYTIEVRNNTVGLTNDATNVVVADNIPAGVTFNSASASQGTCALAGGTVTCSLGTLLSGASAMAIINVTPTAPGTIINNATVSFTEVDTAPGNNSASAMTVVNAAPAPDPAAGGNNNGGSTGGNTGTGGSSSSGSNSSSGPGTGGAGTGGPGASGQGGNGSTCSNTGGLLGLVICPSINPGVGGIGNGGNGTGGNGSSSSSSGNSSSSGGNGSAGSGSANGGGNTGGGSGSSGNSGGSGNHSDNPKPPKKDKKKKCEKDGIPNNCKKSKKSKKH